jgi:predicted aldo/keto reductase-like oxidoreductase
MKRRTLLGRLLAAPAAGLAAAGAAHAQDAPDARPDAAGPIPTRPFGKTGEDLTIIGLAGGRFPLIDRERAIALTRRAVELGINYFDNAHAYWDGRSEEVYGEVLPAVRKRVFLTTKSGNRTRQGAAAELETSLKRLKTDYVDLWQVHGIMGKDDVEKVFAPGGAIEAFEAAKRAGKCRFIGFTGHHDPASHLEMLRRYQGWDSILMPLNAADPHYLSFEKDVLPEAVKRGLGIQGMKNFANAKLLQALSVEDCLRYVLSLPVHCTAVGCTTTGQLEDDARIARAHRPLEADALAALRRRAEGLAGPRLEDWKRRDEPVAGRLADLPPYRGG